MLEPGCCHSRYSCCKQQLVPGLTGILFRVFRSAFSVSTSLALHAGSLASCTCRYLFTVSLFYIRAAADKTVAVQ